MALTFAEVMQQLEEYRYELAIWSLLENALCPYLDKDRHRQAEVGLKVKGCSDPKVPVEVFERVIELIRAEKIEPISQKINSIENLGVEEKDEEEERGAAEEKEAKGAKKKTNRKTRAKKLRTISGRSRKQGAGSG